MSEGSGLPFGPGGGLTESQFLALWGGLPPPLLRLIDLYLLDNPDVPAPHPAMDVDRFQVGLIGWFRRSTDPEALTALHEAVTYFATAACTPTSNGRTTCRGP
jgi:hypothetical protein